MTDNLPIVWISDGKPTSVDKDTVCQKQYSIEVNYTEIKVMEKWSNNSQQTDL